MEILSPTSYLSSSSWLLEESKNPTKWTPEENKMFENALAVYDKDTPDRWHKVAAMIPGKTVGDVIRQYRELEVDVSNIEAGLIPIPGYSTSPFTLEWVNNGYDGFKQSYGVNGKRSSSARPSEQERKKGVPWTEEEHKLFLMGLKKYGKGDWRNISRNFVITRTPTQVASHAQKYFIRQLSGGKDKRRASIHDITTVNLDDMRTPSPENKRPATPDQAVVFSGQPNSGNNLARTHFSWSQTGSNGANTMNYNSSMQANNSNNNKMVIPSNSPYGIHSHGLKIHGQNLHSRGPAHYDSYYGPQNLIFHMNSGQHYSH